MRKRTLVAAVAASVLGVAGAACQPPMPAQAVARYRMAYATYLGGAEFDQGREVIVQADGSLLVAGETASANFPTTPGVLQPRYAGDDPSLGAGGLYGGDCFVSKLSPDGKRLVFSTYFGGSKQERNVYGMELDRQGNVVICSTTRSPDLPTTPGAFQPRFGGGPSDWFAAKMSSDGRRLLWCTYVGGREDESPRGGLALDAQDNVYLVGTTRSADFPTTGAPRPAAGTGGDAALVKLSADGSKMLSSFFLHGSGGQGIMGVRVSPSGDVYWTGHTTSTDIPVTPGAPQRSLGGKSDAYFAKTSADGSRLYYATYLGGRENEFAEHRLWLNADGSAILTGVTASPDFPTTEDAYQRRQKGQNSGFVTCLSPDGQTLRFSTLVGGTGTGFFLMPTRDAQGNIVVVGTTTATDFPTTPGALQARYGGGPSDGVLCVLSPDGSRLLYSTYLGGSGDDLIRGVTLGANGELYLTGSTTSPDFPASAGTLQTKLGGKTDAFVVKLVPETR